MEKITRILLVVPKYQEIRSILEKYDYQIDLIVDTGEEGLKTLGEINVDAVFVHSELNGLMNGIETITFMLSHYRIPIFLLTKELEESDQPNRLNFDIIKSIKSNKAMGVIFEPIHEATLITSLELGFERYYDYFNLFDETKKFQNYVKEAPVATAIFQRGFCRYANSKFIELFHEYSENALNLSTFKFQKILAQLVGIKKPPLDSEKDEQPISFLSIHNNMVDLKQPDGSLKNVLFKSRAYEFKGQVANIVSLVELPANLLSNTQNFIDSAYTPSDPSENILLEKTTSDINIVSEFTAFAEILGNLDLILILDCLKTKSYDVNELAVVIGKSTDTVYKHLRDLQKKKIVIAWKDGNMNTYSLNRTFFSTLASTWRSFYSSLELWFGQPI